MRMKWLAIGIILLFVGTCIIPAIAQVTEKPLSTSRGNWLYVGGSGPGNYTLIQDAINDSNDGDTIIVFDESSPYREYLIIDKSINLIGENENTTIIEGDILIGQHILQLNADGIHLHRFTIKKCPFSDHPRYYAVAINSDNNDVSGNILTENGGGIFVNHSSWNRIYDNRISNKYRFSCLGITIWYGGNNLIFNNRISEVLEGIAIQNSRYNTIIGNSISQIYWGVYLENSVDLGDSGRRYNLLGNKIYKNYVSDAEIGMKIEECRFNFIYLNEITNCNQGMYRYAAGLIFIAENNFINNTCSAFFYAHMGLNQWIRNYWDDWNGTGDYTIYGKTGGPWWYEQVEEYDRFPAQEPHDIQGIR